MDNPIFDEGFHKSVAAKRINLLNFPGLIPCSLLRVAPLRRKLNGIVWIPRGMPLGKSIPVRKNAAYLFNILFIDLR